MQDIIECIHSVSNPSTAYSLNIAFPKINNKANLNEVIYEALKYDFIDTLEEIEKNEGKWIYVYYDFLGICKESQIINKCKKRIYDVKLANDCLYTDNFLSEYF